MSAVSRAGSEPWLNIEQRPFLYVILIAMVIGAFGLVLLFAAAVALMAPEGSARGDAIYRFLGILAGVLMTAFAAVLAVEARLKRWLLISKSGIAIRRRRGTNEPEWIPYESIVEANFAPTRARAGNARGRVVLFLLVLDKRQNRQKLKILLSMGEGENELIEFMRGMMGDRLKSQLGPR